MGVAALALVHDGAHAVARDGAGDEDHVAALAQARDALAAERERLDVELELVAELGARAELYGLAHGPAWVCATSSSSSAFCAWRRFSAWSQMRWRWP